MATLEYKVVGFKDYRKFVNKYSRTAVPAMKRELYTIARHHSSYVKRSMRNTPKDFSRTYGTAGHHPSKPGHPPADRTGNLTSKMHAEPRNYGAIWYIQDAKYAPWLEKGISHGWAISIRKKKALSDGITFFGTNTKHPGIKPRPFVGPALKRNQRHYNNRLKQRALSSIRNAKMGVGL